MVLLAQRAIQALLDNKVNPVSKVFPVSKDREVTMARLVPRVSKVFLGVPGCKGLMVPPGPKGSQVHKALLGPQDREVVMVPV
jgi:hypothetical protein